MLPGPAGAAPEPGIDEVPEELAFLRQYPSVTFAQSVAEEDVLDRLQWGITGQHPRRG
jgi:hypothetical protein